MIVKDDGCTSRSGFRLDPSDIPIFSLVDDVQPFGRCIPEYQEFTIRIADLNRGIIDAHRLGRNFVRADDSWQPLAEYFLDLDDGGCRNDSRALVIVVSLASHIAAFVLEYLFLDLVQNGGDRGVNIGGTFFAVVKIIPLFDFHFREVALMFLNREGKMRDVFSHGEEFSTDMYPSIAAVL